MHCITRSLCVRRMLIEYLHTIFEDDIILTANLRNITVFEEDLASTLFDIATPTDFQDETKVEEIRDDNLPANNDNLITRLDKGGRLNDDNINFLEEDGFGIDDDNLPVK